MFCGLGPAHPTAQHTEGPVHAMEFKPPYCCPVAAVRTTNHDVPFQRSTRDTVEFPFASVLVPVAQHEAEAEHETPRRYPSSESVLTNDHDDPFQCSTKGEGAPVCGRPQTAQQLSASTQLTAVKSQLSPTGTSVGTVVHAEPFQCWMTPRKLLPPFSNCPPTDQQSHASTQVDPRSRVCAGADEPMIDHVACAAPLSIAGELLASAPAGVASVIPAATPESDPASTRIEM